MKKILEDLIFLGAVQEEVSLLGKKWKMQTLNSEEHLSATSSTGDYETLSRIYALKLEILCRSLKAIDGIQLDDESETFEFVRKLQPPIINKLYEEYEKLQQKQNDSLRNIDDIKN